MKAMKMENNEEHEGVTLHVDTEGWPNNLTGLVLNKQIVYVKDGIVTIIGDPIWSLVAEENEDATEEN